MMPLKTKITKANEEKPGHAGGKAGQQTEKRKNRPKKKGKGDDISRVETDRKKKAKPTERKKSKTHEKKKVAPAEERRQDSNDKDSSSLLPAYQVSFGVTNCGKRVATTKRRVQWRYVFTNTAAAAGGVTTDEEHNVILVWSITSGKRQITMNEEVICTSISRSSVFEYSWTWRGSHTIKLIAHMTAIPGFRQYDLIMNDKSFFSLPKFLEIGSELTEITSVASSVSLASFARKKGKKAKKDKKKKKLDHDDQRKKAAKDNKIIKEEEENEVEEEDEEESTRSGMQYLTQQYFGDKKKPSNHRKSDEHEKGGGGLFQTMKKKREKLKHSLDKWLDDSSQQGSETEASATDTEGSITTREEEEGESDFDSLIDGLDDGCDEDGNALYISDSFWLDQDQEWNELKNMSTIEQILGPEEISEEPRESVVRRQAFHNMIQQLEEENADFKQGKHHHHGSDSEDEGMPLGIHDDEDVIIHVQAMVRGYLVRQRMHKEMLSSSVSTDTSNLVAKDINNSVKSNNSNVVAEVGNSVVGFWLWVSDGADRYIDPDRYARKEKASVRIQAAYRGYRARRQDNVEAIMLAYLQRLEC